jgi:hemerythrin-like domain-containing protein
VADPISGWHEEHARFSQLLDLLQRETDAIHRGDAPNYELMADVVYYLRHFGDSVHHPREDVAFRRLVRLQPSLELKVNRLHQEHRVIAVAGEELLKLLDGALDDVMVPRAELEAAAMTYLVYYRQHLAAEEREILPLAARLLTADDWAAASAGAASLQDPLFGGAVSARFRELRRQIDREADATGSGR